MNRLACFDTEIEPDKGKILDIGCITDNQNIFHKNSLSEFVTFVQDIPFLCGHNVIKHDLKYIGNALADVGFRYGRIIDTLYLSPLLFPTKPYHALLKDDKILSDELNNPLNDSIKAHELFLDEVSVFNSLDDQLKSIYYSLLNSKKEFNGFFAYIEYACAVPNLNTLIRQRFENEICENIDLDKIISAFPVELAYCLSFINSLALHRDMYSITPPWVLKNYCEVERIMQILRNRPCVTGCKFCNNKLNIHVGLKKYFGFDNFRTYGDEPLQENAVKAAVNGKSILAIFPTGGGKSITFQVPALMSAENTQGLTIIISPLQSLMKDQVDNLEKAGITEAVTINGLLDPIERAKSFERIEDGSASILYISPESLRSRSIEKLILGRKIERFVIDEAHCFSSWGHDFRVDYLYIGDFIRSVQLKKNMADGIPVSCFTATAKQKVIEDIKQYFKEKLNLELELFTSKVSRTNLHFKVYAKSNEEDKYQTLRQLIDEKNCPTIVYVSRTRKASQLAERLTEDGLKALPFHGKMDSKQKTENQDAFISGNITTIVATSAFGMGVDKKDVGMVVHYEISDSLENYVQEAGRAGRDDKIQADCFILFDEKDLDKHFVLLNQTKISIKEIQQVWKAIKEITKFRNKVSNSALEIARKAGWDDNVVEIETRVTSAIAALENAGYLKRGQNIPKIFANSILTKTAQQAIEKINLSNRFTDKQRENAVRIIKKLISSKSRKQATDDAGESRIDYISDHLGIVKEEVINIITLLREENILADSKDLTAFIKRAENKNRSLQIVTTYGKIEQYLLKQFEEEAKTFHIKDLNEKAEQNGCEQVSTAKIKTVLNFWSIKNQIEQHHEQSKNHFSARLIQPKEKSEEKLEKRLELARFIVDYLYEKSKTTASNEEKVKEEILVEFSVQDLKSDYEKHLKLFNKTINTVDIEDTLFYLSKIEAIKIEGGFMVIYNQLTIERLENDRSKKFTKDDYQPLNQFYEGKIQQIHIVGEYANRMIEDYKDALQFVDDYFTLNYQSFLNKYFKGSRQGEIKRNLTPTKFKQLFGDLSPTQLKIINDKDSKHIVVAAGPGSGKTRILVHKLASLLLMEDVKHEQLLMLTFSRAAANEFKKRLMDLIGNAAHYIEIKTFHSYCFDLLGKIGSVEKSDQIISTTIEKILSHEVEVNKITKTVLVIDEAQDMNAVEFNLIKALMDINDEMRVIAVGDDDQNIFEFRGSDSKYLEEFIESNNAVKYELPENYRSKSNLTDFSNQFAATIHHRLKNTPIVAKRPEDGMIKIINYQSKNLIEPLVNDLINTDITGSTCILTINNEDAFQITGLLIKHGIKAKLIQSNEGFSLLNLIELRYFYDSLQLTDGVYVIPDENWEQAKLKLKNAYQNSRNYEICKNIISEFEKTNPQRKFKSDFESFVQDSKLQDFYSIDSEIITVSTIHKAKGREFDNVIILLKNVDISTDVTKRLLYVAMTRAKNNLTIHDNNNIFHRFHVPNQQVIADNNNYSVLDEIVLQLNLKQVWLDSFISRQATISGLKCGDELIVSENECHYPKGRPILKFSQLFRKETERLQLSNYKLTKVKVNFLVYWYKEEIEKEFVVILPEVSFRREG